jgi:hypothetical protein
MRPTLKACGVLLSGLMLCFGLTHADATEMKGSQSEKKDKQATPGKALQKQGLHMIRGEVMRIEGQNYLVKNQEGREVSLHVDTTTLKTDKIHTGDRIEAKVNQENHAVSILQATK